MARGITRRDFALGAGAAAVADGAGEGGVAGQNHQPMAPKSSAAAADAIAAKTQRRRREPAGKILASRGSATGSDGEMSSSARYGAGRPIAPAGVIV